MIRQLVLGAGALSITQQTTASIQLSRSLSSRTNSHNRNGSGNVSSIEEWLTSFNNNDEAIPSSIFKTKFDPYTGRKSKRTSRRLTCQVAIGVLKNYVPPKVLEKVRDSREYQKDSEAIVTASNKTKSISANRDDCAKQIRDIIRETARSIIAEASKRPLKQLSKTPFNHFSKSEAKKRFDAQKKLQRMAKFQEKARASRR